MRTFILRWNPDGSSYSLTDFQRDFPNMEYGEFHWEVGQSREVRSGDNFYLIKTGRGRRGVVMKGFFTSDPYPVKKGSTSYAAGLRPTFMFHPDIPKGILTLDELAAAIPDFGWEDGTSGQMLSDGQAEVLDRMWERFLGRYDDCDFDGILADRNRRPEAGIDDAVALAAEVLYDREDSRGEPLILRSLREGLLGSSADGMIRGFLHEVIASPDWDAGALRDKGFSEAVVDGLVH